MEVFWKLQNSGSCGNTLRTSSHSGHKKTHIHGVTVLSAHPNYSQKSYVGHDSDKIYYTIIDLVLQTLTKNETELVWHNITLIDQSKCVVDSFWSSLTKGPVQFLNFQVSYPRLRISLEQPKTTLIFDGDFNAGGIEW